jgi:hypothetical protein
MDPDFHDANVAADHFRSDGHPHDEGHQFALRLQLGDCAGGRLEARSGLHLSVPCPWNFRRHKTLLGMDYETQEKLPPTKEERAAKKEKARQEAEKALAVRKKEDEAFRANFERLKAERLARQADKS